MTRRSVGAIGPRVFSIDRSSPVPLYFQLAQQFESAITSGALPPGSRVENEEQLARCRGVSRPTVRAAFLFLVEKGLVGRTRGQGALVAQPKVNRGVGLTSLYDALANADKSP